MGSVFKTRQVDRRDSNINFRKLVEI